MGVLINSFIAIVVHIFLLLAGADADNVTVAFSDSDAELEIGETQLLTLHLIGKLNGTAELVFTYQVGNDIRYFDEGYIILPFPNLTVYPGNQSLPINITGSHAGHVTLGLNSTSTEFRGLESSFVRVEVVHISALILINAIIGWLYFAAWSVSFYPQMYINWKRKSVVGLNFDFVAYNITGFLAYGFFNVGMFWVSGIKDQYMSEHPRGINPVQLNDVIFTLHAVFATCLVIGQCLVYEKGGQKVSKVCIILVTVTWLFVAITLIVTLVGKITWLIYLYYFSYIKLGVTLIKYVPQAWMNYKRKSTCGWSIGNVLLDFTGGMLSLLQMFFLAYNSDDWGSIFGDPTKFGLGLFSILFDILFMVQHYCLYSGHSKYELIGCERDVTVDGKEIINSPRV